MHILDHHLLGIILLVLFSLQGVVMLFSPGSLRLQKPEAGGISWVIVDLRSCPERRLVLSCEKSYLDNFSRLEHWSGHINFRIIQGEDVLFTSHFLGDHLLHPQLLNLAHSVC